MDSVICISETRGIIECDSESSDWPVGGRGGGGGVPASTPGGYVVPMFDLFDGGSPSRAGEGSDVG